MDDFETQMRERLPAVINTTISDLANRAAFHRGETFEVWISDTWAYIGQPPPDHPDSNANHYCSIRWDRDNEVIVRYEDGSDDVRLYV